MNPIRYPHKIDLARTPTPVEPLPRMSAKIGLELIVKRDDLTGTALSGNKVRKLEFLLADALAQGADMVITGGGEQSNHCRATAVAAARMGLGCVVLLRVPDPNQPPPLSGNSLLDALVGAEIRWIDPTQWVGRVELFEQVAQTLRAAGRRPYVIAEGGSSPVGVWGYVQCVEEMADQLADANCTLLYAAGSGGTGAGLLLGVKRLGLPCRVVGVNVCNDRAYFVKTIGTLVEQTIARYGTDHGLDVPFQRSEIEILDGYVGRGYAKSRPEELALIRDLARAEGLILDPVYTGKAFYGMVEQHLRTPGSLGRRVLFLHSGGIYGLFPKQDQLAALL